MVGWGGAGSNGTVPVSKPKVLNPNPGTEKKKGGGGEGGEGGGGKGRGGEGGGEKITNNQK
jgi:hypothetical protein